MLSDMDTYYRSGGANDWRSLRSRPLNALGDNASWYAEA